MRLHRVGTGIAWGAVAAAVLVGCTHTGATTSPSTPVPASSAVATSTAATAVGGTTAATAATANGGTPSSAPGGTGVPGTTPPVVASGAVAAASGPGLCTATVTRMDTDPGAGGGAGGHFAFSVHVVNASSSPCVTTGYPGVALLDGAGQQVEQALRTTSGYMGGLWDGSSAPRIVLQPGDQATALIEGENHNPTGDAPCSTSRSLLFTLPDNTDPTTLSRTTPVCEGLQVHPLVAGPSGTVGT